MKKWKVKFQAKQYEELKAYLFSTTPFENGCFALGKSKGKLLFIQDIIYPESEEMVLKKEDSCIPSSKYIAYASTIADQNSQSLIFIHTHPAENHPSTFSSIDIISNEKLFENLGSFLSEPISSLVMSLKGIHGVVYQNSKVESIQDFSVYGEKFVKMFDTSKTLNVLDIEEYDRQLRMMGNTTTPIQNLKIAVVGLGGIGSPLSVMLAKMGIIHFGFYDKDLVEIHNLPRILGANKSSIGKLKINVVKNFITSFCDAEIETFNFMVDESTDLTGYDIIFGCVDNHTARDILNRKAYESSILYIDSACSIPLDEEGSVQQAAISVSSVTPSSSCLWCNKSLDGMRIMEESLSTAEKQQRINDGYTQEVEKSPSVISLTTAVATFAINRMLSLLGVYQGEYSEKLVYDYNSSLLIEPQIEKSESCLCTINSPFRKTG